MQHCNDEIPLSGAVQPLEVRETCPDRCYKACQLAVWSPICSKKLQGIVKLAAALESGRYVARDIGKSRSSGRERERERERERFLLLYRADFAEEWPRLPSSRTSPPCGRGVLGGGAGEIGRGRRRKDRSRLPTRFVVVAARA